MRLFSIHDPHLRSSCPRSRRDPDYLMTCLGKIEYVLADAQAAAADAILCPGDLLETPMQTPRARNRFINLLSSYAIPFITTVGSHDVQGRRCASYYEESDLGTLEAAGVVNVLHAGKEFAINDVVISGYGDGEPETIDLLDGLFTRPKGDAKFRIALVHAAFGGTAEKMGRGAAIESCKIKGVDLALFGDIHDDPWYNHAHRTGVHSFNPGALLRKTREEIEREPKYLDITVSPYEADGHDAETFAKEFKIDKDAWVRVTGDTAWVAAVKEKIVPHLPPHIAFDMDAINQEVAQHAQSFAAAVSASRAAKTEDPEKTLIRVAEECSFSRESAELAISHLEN